LYAFFSYFFGFGCGYIFRFLRGPLPLSRMMDEWTWNSGEIVNRGVLK
jgi:hypothetical protein